jgi:acetoacetyl-CoA synthetase
MKALVAMARMGEDLDAGEASALVAAGLRKGGTEADELPLAAAAEVGELLAGRLAGFDVLVTGEAAVPLAGEEGPVVAAARLAEAAGVPVVVIGAAGEVPPARLHELGLGRFLVAGDAEALGAAGEGIAAAALPGACIWRPSAAMVEGSQMAAFARWAEARHGRGFDGYADLHRWSVTELEEFWGSIWEYFDLQADGDPGRVLVGDSMPGAEWFPDLRLSYAEHVLAGRDDDEVALVHASELRPLTELTWGELRAQVAACAGGLRGLGVEAGDRVVSYLPNIAEAVIAFLASASVGAVWSSCSPDFGVATVADRFAQIEPKVLFAPDGYRYGGRDFDRLAAVAELQERLPSLRHTVVLPYLGAAPDLGGLRDAILWEELLARGQGAELEFARLPFDHPLWILYSSGTTGLPKAIVHGQGGILLEHIKQIALQFDLRPGDRFFWFTTTGWMVWNFLVSGLLGKAEIVLFDGNPGHPDLGTLWDLAERARVGTFGVSAAYIGACMKAGIEPAAGRDLTAMTAVGSTGSPLSPEGFDWIYEQLGADTWLASGSGGTDVCTGFVGGVPILPVYKGELQGAALGSALEAWSDDGEALVDQVGELVITRPMPSMPVYFWNDPDGTRYRESYFDTFPGVWRHGDWVEMTQRGSAVIYGRSDSTINRGGIRMGTSEIYRAVLEHDDIVDALVVDVPRRGTEGWMALFVVLRDGADLDDRLRADLARRIRERCSPRHVPDEVFAIAEVPRTLSNKVLEVPVKRILMGIPASEVASRDSLANPAALDWFVDLAARWDGGRPQI